MTKPKPTVQLYDSIGTGLIIEYESGIIISNQTGGSCCLHPEIEGIYIPLRNDYSEKTREFISPETKLIKYFTDSKHAGAGAISGIDEEDADFIDSLLSQVKLNPTIRVNRSKLKESHEAWIHVEITGNESTNKHLSAFADFEPYPRSGIFTWCNSD